MPDTSEPHYPYALRGFQPRVWRALHRLLDLRRWFGELKARVLGQHPNPSNAYYTGRGPFGRRNPGHHVFQ